MTLSKILGMKQHTQQRMLQYIKDHIYQDQTDLILHFMEDRALFLKFNLNPMEQCKSTPIPNHVNPQWLLISPWLAEMLEPYGQIVFESEIGYFWFRDKSFELLLDATLIRLTQDQLQIEEYMKHNK